MKPVLALIALAIIALPSVASATIAEECDGRGGTWVGDPIGSMDSGFCMFKMPVNPKLGGRYAFTSDASCRASGGEVRSNAGGKQCALSPSAVRKFSLRGQR